MSSLTAIFHPTLSFTRARRSRVSTLLADYAAGIRDARRAAAQYERLSQMSNSELARLGLSRQDIARMAFIGSLA
jgi:uncharacterized protein YjiS (DUF1127 family)